MNNLKNLYFAFNASRFHSKHKAFNRTMESFSRLYLLSSRNFSCSSVNKDVPRVTITLEKEDGSCLILKCEAGANLRDVIASHAKEIGDNYGLCDGTLACSTCHVIFNEEDFDKIPHENRDEELDILDLAPSATPTSRLACAITITPELEGIKVKIPDDRKDARALNSEEE